VESHESYRAPTKALCGQHSRADSSRPFRSVLGPELATWPAALARAFIKAVPIVASWRSRRLVGFVRDVPFCLQSRKKLPILPAIWQNYGIFLHNIFAAANESSMMAGIGASAPRLHGFHRFLPRLWELFFRRVFTASRAAFTPRTASFPLGEPVVLCNN
jgi:hypothetical protein